MTFFIVFINILLGSVVFIRNPRRSVNRYFSVVIFGIVFWSLSAFFFNQIENSSLSVFLARSAFVGAMFIAWGFLKFSLHFPKTLRKFSYWRTFLFDVFFIILVISGFSPFIVSSVSSEGDAIYGSFYYIFLLWFLVVMIFGLIVLILQYQSSSGVQRRQIQYVFLGFLISVSIASFTNLVFPIITKTSSLSNFGPYSTVVLVAFVSYAIVRHRLLNIRLILVSTFLYLTLVGFVSVSYVLFAILLGSYLQNAYDIDIYVTTIITSFLIVITLEPLKNAISYVTDSIFFRRKINYTSVLKRMVTILNTEIELEPLISALKKEVPQELKVKSAAFVLSNKHGGGYSSKGFDGDSIVRLSAANPFVTYIKKNQEVLVLEEFQRKLADTPPGKLKNYLEDVHTHFESLGCAVVVPIFVQDEISGFILIGNRLSGEAFSNEDINFFQVLSPQVGTAISKAQLYQQVKDFNAQLKKRVDRATKQLKETNIDLQKRNHFLSALQHITNLIIKSFDFQKVAQILVDEIHKELGYIGGILYVVDKQKKHLQVRAVTRSPMTNRAIELLPKDYLQYKLPIKGEHCYLSKCYRDKKIIIGTKFKDFTSSVFPDELSDQIQKVIGMQSGVAVPIFDEEEVIGVLYYFLQDRRQSITALDKQMMRALADQTGIFARNLRLVEEVKHYNDRLKIANDHLRQLDKAKSEFMSIASHQLRTPMTGIMGYLSMLLEGDYGKFSKNQQNILESIMEASQRMIRLVNVFLNVTRIESGRLKLQFSEINMLNLIDEEINELLITAKDKNIKLIYNRPKKDCKTVIGDADKIKDIVINLVDNAIKYTPKGSVTVTATEKKKGIHVSVQDTGIGIAKGEDKKLFQKFVRGSGIAQVQPDGSGLGLFIAKKVVEAHGGEIYVESPGKGEGSNFQFFLPFVPKDYKKSDK